MVALIEANERDYANVSSYVGVFTEGPISLSSIGVLTTLQSCARKRYICRSI